jgi:hypothetical protein
MRRYIIAFSIAQALAITTAVALIILADIDLGVGGNLAGTFGSVMVAATLFVRDRRRAPTPVERLQLTWLTFGATFAVSLLAVAILVTATHVLGYAEELEASLEAASKAPWGIWVVAVSIIAIFYWAGIFLTYRCYGPLCERALFKRNAL